MIDYYNMSEFEVMQHRHSVRAYTEDPIPGYIRQELDDYAEKLNAGSGLHIFLRYDDPEGFDSALAHYGRFRNVKNYIVLAGKKEAVPASGEDYGFEFSCGYCGEAMVLKAQRLGLNTCWTALTFNRKKVRELIPEGEELCMVIALGYGQTQGIPHKGKKISDVCSSDFDEGLLEGVEAALLAPTAINQQKFWFFMEEGEPCIKVKGIGSWTRVDLGIAAYHFEAVTGFALNVR